MNVVHAEELHERCEELRAMYRSARLRFAELEDTQRAMRERRAEVRANRLRLRTAAADRLAQHRDRSRAAAAILEAATNAADISMIELWVDYFSLGGARSLGELRATMDGRLPIDRYNHDLVALALNERLIDQGFEPFLTYWDGTRAVPKFTP